MKFFKWCDNTEVKLLGFTLSVTDWVAIAALSLTFAIIILG